METKGQICRAPWDPVKWTMIFKSSTSTAFRNPGQLGGWSGVAWATMKHHPGLTTPPLFLGKTSQTELSPRVCPPPSTIPLRCWWWRDYFLPTPWFFTVLINFISPERCVTLSSTSSPVREVCGHVGLGVSDLRISTITLKRDKCCTAWQKCRKSVFSHTDNTEHFQKGRGELLIPATCVN